MQGGEHEVPGLGRGQCGGHRLEVAHLAEQDHVGVLAQPGAERLGEAAGVGADLPLVDDAALVVVEELDRVLDREDVRRPGVVDLVDQRRKRRRLSGAGWPGDEHQPARPAGKLVQGVGQAEILERENLVRDQAERRADAVALEEDVDAEARDAGDGVRDVDLPLDLEPLLLLGRQDAVQPLAGVVGGQRREIGDRLDLAPDPDRRRGPHAQVEIGSAPFEHAPE